MRLALPTLVAVAFLYGVTNKLADLMNEHGLFWFRGAATVFGFVWGGLGAILTLAGPQTAVLYLSLTLSWFLALKLDYPNHAIAGVLTVLAAVVVAGTDELNVGAVAVMTGAYYLSGLLQGALRGRRDWLDRLLRLRLRLYLIPLGYSIYVGDAVPFTLAAAGMVGVEIVTNYYRVAHQIN